MSENKNNVKKLAKPAAPQLAPVAVLTITYAPPLQRVIAIQPAFPLQMNAQDALTVLRAAEKFITDDILEKAKQQTPAVENVG